MSADAETIVRRRFDVRGQVQGVGFRPFVYRLASACCLGGFVANNGHGAVIEIEGPAAVVGRFEGGLRRGLPPLARITELLCYDQAPRGERRFQISGSRDDSVRSPEVTPDAAVCRDCLRELFDPSNRRYRYPFITCTNCGPRYSLICGVPYDRPTTTMADFQMCPSCQAEYGEPQDRRFHAQPIACAECGPEVRLDPPDIAAPGENAIRRAAELLRAGKIVAVKGIGGYHLACRADREDAVRRLRERKLRNGKPLALMVPDLASAQRLCHLCDSDLAALGSPAAPIVLAPQRAGHGLAASVAPGCRDFGVMLAYTPLHHLLFAEGLGPLVMTSANLAGDPLTYQDDVALTSLNEVADAFLLHNRRIFRPIDDSVVFTFRGDTVPLRRARGYAPQPLRFGGPLRAALPDTIPPILALGGELKSTVCLYAHGEAILSEHLGELTHPAAYRHFVEATTRLCDLFAFEPRLVAHDLHPRYLSTEYALRLNLPTVAVQHHHAHVASLMAEWNETGPLIGVACDGVGYGTDGAAWGGEILCAQLGRCERLGHIEYFPLVGGDQAALETWRPAAALLRAAFGDRWREMFLELVRNGAREPLPSVSGAPLAPWPQALEVFERQSAARLNAPLTSSLGRVFDAVSFLLGLCKYNRHDAEAALSLESAADEIAPAPFGYELRSESQRLVLSVTPLIRELIAERRAGTSVGRLAARFHETVAHMLADAAAMACEQRSVSTVALSGGCFANRRLLTRLVELLEKRRLRVLYHRVVPCGDNGLGLGQALVAAAHAVEPAPLDAKEARACA